MNEAGNSTSRNHTKPELYFEVAAFAVALVLTLTLNTMVLIVFWKRMQKKSGTITLFLTNLAACQELVGLVVMPFVIISILYDGWKHMPVLCQANGFTTSTIFYASVFSLCLVSIDRLFAIVCAMKYRAIITKKRGKFMISLVWLCAAIFSLPPLIGWSRYEYHPGTFHCSPLWVGHCSYYYFVFILAVVLPLSITCVSYSLIFYTVRRQRIRISMLKNGKTTFQAGRSRRDGIKEEISKMNHEFSHSSNSRSEDPDHNETHDSDQKYIGEQSSSQDHSRSFKPCMGLFIWRRRKKHNILKNSSSCNNINMEDSLPTFRKQRNTIRIFAEHWSRASRKASLVSLKKLRKTSSANQKPDGLTSVENDLSNKGYVDDDKESIYERDVPKDVDIDIEPQTMTTDSGFRSGSPKKNSLTTVISTEEFPLGVTNLQSDYLKTSIKEFNEQELSNKSCYDLREALDDDSKELDGVVRCTKRRLSDSVISAVPTLPGTCCERDARRLRKQPTIRTRKFSFLNRPIKTHKFKSLNPDFVYSLHKERKGDGVDSAIANGTCTAADESIKVVSSQIHSVPSIEIDRFSSCHIQEDTMQTKEEDNNFEGKNPSFRMNHLSSLPRRKISVQSVGTRRTLRKSNSVNREYQVAKTGFLLVITFCICYGPYAIVYSCHENFTIAQWAQHFAMWCVFLYSILSPIIYGLKTKDVRDDIFKLCRRGNYKL